MMYPAIDNAASCEIFAVIRFPHAKNMTPTEIHRELCAVYCQNIMNEGTVKRLCRTSKDGWRRIHDGERSGRPAINSE
jgi:hypothetical protein